MNAERLRRAALRGLLVGLGAAGGFSAVIAHDHARGIEILGACVTGAVAGVCLALASLVELAFADRPASGERNLKAAAAVYGVSLVGAALAVFQVAYTVIAFERDQFQAIRELQDLLKHVVREPAPWFGLSFLGAAAFPTGTYARLAWEKGEHGWLVRGIAIAFLNGVGSLPLGVLGLCLIPGERGLFGMFLLAIAVPSAFLIELADAVCARLWPVERE